jgi:hypothetical protein
MFLFALHVSDEPLFHRQERCLLNCVMQFNRQCFVHLVGSSTHLSVLIYFQLPHWDMASKFITAADAKQAVISCLQTL